MSIVTPHKVSVSVFKSFRAPQHRLGNIVCPSRARESLIMRRITPRTCLWPLVGCITATFALSIGLTFRSNHHCYAGTCGEVLFPLQARTHVLVWYIWLSLSIGILGLRTFQLRVRSLMAKTLGVEVPYMGKQLRIGGLLLVLWISSLYGIIVGIWWTHLLEYFEERGAGLPGNSIVSAVAMSGHLADVSMGMVLLPVARHSALASFFKLSPSTTYTFHMTMAYVLFSLVIVHGSLYADWAGIWNQERDRFRPILPILNPTYYYDQTWPGDRSAVGIWRASLVFTGSLAAMIMLIIFLTSFPAIRRRYFNAFYFCHLLGIIAVVIICLHASTMFYCTIPGLSMWLLDWSMRLLELRQKLNSRLRSLGNGWYRYVHLPYSSNPTTFEADNCSLSLSLPRQRLSGCACHSPLAHFYIHHSESSVTEIHPFTTITHLASKKTLPKDEHSIEIQFLFRRMAHAAPEKTRQWTNKLGALIDEESLNTSRQNSASTTLPSAAPVLNDLTDDSIETILRLEGPYFTPANPERYKTTMCLVAGTGLSGAIAIAAAFQAQRSLQRADPEAISEAVPVMSGGKCRLTAENGALHWTRCIVIWTVRESDFVNIPYLTGELEYVFLFIRY